MVYKYYNILSTDLASTPKQEMLDAYQSELDKTFSVATDLFTIQEENLDTGLYSDVTVRLNAVYGDTGKKLGDDYRKVIFSDITHLRSLGTKFIFDDGSTWLTINYDEYGKPTASVIIQKCRNVLKWIDRTNGAVNVEPCTFDYNQNQSVTPSFNKYVSVPNGYTGISVQVNDNTKQFEVNDRFILNGLCYKIWNIYKILNNPTQGQVPIEYLIVGADEVNTQTDDLVNSIANYNDYNYSLAINQKAFSGIVSATGTLSASVMLNQTEEVTRNVVWTSSDETAVAINATTGAYVLNALGSSVITASLKGNSSVSANITVTVVESVSPNYHISVSPDQRKILQGDSMDISVYCYNNDTKTDDVFSYSASGANASCYTIDSVSGNVFRVYNNQKSSQVLNIVFHDETRTVGDLTVAITLGGVF